VSDGLVSSARFTALVVLAGLVVGGLVYDTATDDGGGRSASPVEAGIAIPAARAEPTLSSTWFCAAGTAHDGGFGDHVVLMSNPSARARTATITALAGQIAAAPTVADPGASTSSTKATTSKTSTTTTPPTTVAPAGAKPPSSSVPLPAHSRVAFHLRDLVDAPLAGAVVEVDGGQIAVEHELTGPLGRAAAPCSTTTSATWSFPWGVTSRGDRELLVFMNPFPDDATVDIAFATDEGVRDTVRFRGFVVPGRSVVGAYIDEDVTRKEQVSAKVSVRGGRVVVDRVQTFDGSDGRDGMAVGLGAPAAAQTWMFPDGLTGSGLSEQIVLFNPGKGVAEAEVEVRLDKPDVNGTPEPFEITVAPGRYTILDLGKEDRIPPDIGHSSIARSLNGVPIIAERVVSATGDAKRHGVGATLGSPVGARTWYFPAGGTSSDRDEFITLFNTSSSKIVTYSVTGLANGQVLAIEGLQDLRLGAGDRKLIRLGEHVQRDDLALVITADGPIVAERGLFRVGGDGLSQAIGIPQAGDDIVVPDPLNG
jgi:hypothetical protein